MHRGNHHLHPHGEFPHAHGPGHNHAERPVAQWQTPHQPEATAEPAAAPEPDFDLVEAAFADAFPKAPDATSFLRLAGVPFVGRGPDGARLFLLRVESEESVDVGSVTPALGGAGVRYAPMPERLVSRRRCLRFLYTDGRGTVALSLGAAKSLVDETLRPDAGDSEPGA